jgi:hypothetical protein
MRRRGDTLYFAEAALKGAGRPGRQSGRVGGRVHRNTLRNPSSERLQGRLREMVKVITAAATLSGDIDKAIYWFRNEPIADYDHKTAAELVAQGHTEAVLAYLCDLENGARG